MLTDSQELAVITDSLKAVNAINDFFEQLLSVGNNGRVILEVVEANPTCAIPYGKPSRASSGARRYLSRLLREKGYVVRAASPFGRRHRRSRSLVYANAHAAAFHLFSGTGDAKARATAFLNTAKANLKRANEREQLYIAAIDAGIKRDIRKAMPYGKPLTRLRSSQSYC